MNSARATVMIAAYGITILCTMSVDPANAQEVIELPGEDRPLEASFEEVYRVGTAMTGEAWQQFGRVRSLAFDGAGNLHIFDELPQLVYVVGTDGSLIRELGGPGDGPGEFSTSGAMTVFADGRVVVVDIRRGYHVFAADGTPERLVRTANPTGPATWAATRRARPGSRTHSARTVWWRSWSRTSWVCRPWWSDDSRWGHADTRCARVSSSPTTRIQAGWRAPFSGWPRTPLEAPPDQLEMSCLPYEL